MYTPTRNVLASVALISPTLGAGYMKVSLSCGHQQEPLTRNSVQAFIQSLRGRPEVKKIHVKGVAADDVIDTLDLLDFKLSDEEEVQARQFRQVPFADRIGALHRMINANLPELDIVLGNPE